MKKLVCMLYSFDELSESAKHEVCENDRKNDYNWGWISQESDASERKSTLDKFCEVFGIKYDIDYDHCHRFISWHFLDEELENSSDEICGKYLWRFLNKYYYKIRSRKWFSTCMVRKNGKSVLYASKCKGAKDRYSKIIWVEQNCPFTGMSYDCDILDKIFDWYKNSDWKISLKDLFDDCFYHYMTLWEQEDDYRMSDEAIGDMISANWPDKLYFEDGTEFTGDYDDCTDYLEDEAA